MSKEQKKIQRKTGFWTVYEQAENLNPIQVSANDIIDAACEVVNEYAGKYLGPITDLAATLEPFTEEVPQERFYADGNRVRSRLRLGDGNPEVDFPVTNDATATDVAAFMNSLTREDS